MSSASSSTSTSTFAKMSSNTKTKSSSSASSPSAKMGTKGDKKIAAPLPPIVYDDEDVNTTVFEVHEWGTNRWIRLEVIEPVTITAKNFLNLSTSFTTYLIRIETNHYAFSLPVSEVRRRYSEFVWLKNKLEHHHPNKIVPPVPPKKYFHITKFNKNIIENRRFGLGKFLQRVMRSSVLLSDSALHYFLQTDKSIKEIEELVSESRLPSQSAGIASSGAINISKNPITYKRPYLLRSVSCSSASSSEGHSLGCPDDESGSEGHDPDDDFLDISSSEECGELEFTESA